MQQVKQLFMEHPASVGESYWRHLLTASCFAGKMLLGAAVCLLHAVLPFIFIKTGSRIIGDLHASMLVNRDRTVAPNKTESQPGQ